MLVLLLAACGAKNASEEPPAPQPAPCPFVYVYAPGNYIIDIAGGADVVLDPMAQDFSLFCAPTDARAALNAEIAAGRLPEGDWRIYRVEGQFDDLAQKSGPNQYTLKRMAPIVDWVTEDI
ncbi:hypothetical protein CE91St39_15390 [Desulfovibrionaceae bacterium]|nr:hypothetical protein CE91St39_15390 [Desulfovibrionaceae bacterium]